MRRAGVGVLVLALAFPARGEPPGPGDRLQKALLWALVPGGGHAYLGEQGAAAAYASSVGALTAGGFWLHERNERWDRDDEINTPWLLALKTWELSLFTTYRSGWRAEGCKPEAAGIDPSPVGRLFLAPFQRRNFSDPAVLFAAALGVAAGAWDARHAKSDWEDVARIGVLGATANQEWGAVLYGADAITLSLAAGVSEEALWRGVIQHELEALYGPRAGWWSASLAFGALHIVDLDGRLRGERVAVATLAGLYLGRLFQADGHRLARPISAHFWYNAAALLTSFAVDPEGNPLGVKVAWAF